MFFPLPVQKPYRQTWRRHQPGRACLAFHPTANLEEASGGSGNDRVRNLQSEVEGVKNIMTQNVERILARGENLDHLRNKTEDLEATSEHFKTTSQKVARKFWWKNVKMIVLICVVVFIIILFIVLFATGAIPV
ncbi:vesicle-associated membrane protein 8 isoform X1 [Loxodonta africana]|uniref:vesicle-associated membrane protein 8 isoform X1 n=1 Tax=Loxodonta africana TaxID=9785 RepID=UPI000C811224|nr:vesicle-associated membrane protein 8 isoform X1 [Loxodonta africana]